MENKFKVFQIIFTAIGSFFGVILGNMDGFLIALLTFIVCDYLTGWIIALIKHELSSEIGFKGIAKKCLIIIFVGIANVLDVYVIKEGGTMLRTAVIFFYISNEGLSIIENAAIIGLPVPTVIKDKLLQLREDKK